MLSRQRRRRLFADLRGLVLEIGTGTGKNLAYLCERDDIELIAIDPSARMLERAAARARHLGRQVELHAATAQRLPFGDANFDAVIASFVFCSVASPMAGLREARRVLRPGGALRLLEHQRPATPWLAPLFDLVNPVAVRLTGANVNRRTEENVKSAGFDDVSPACTSTASASCASSRGVGRRGASGYRMRLDGTMKSGVQSHRVATAPCAQVGTSLAPAGYEGPCESPPHEGVGFPKPTSPGGLMKARRSKPQS